MMSKAQEQVYFQCTHQSRVYNSHVTKLCQARWKSCMLYHTCPCEEETEVYCCMEHQGVRENFASLLRRHGKAKELHEGHLVHAHIIMLGYEETTFLTNSVIEMYGNCEQVKEAKILFENLANPNVYSFNIALKTYGRNGMLDHARELFWKMLLRDVVSWSTMIGALTQSGHYEEALDVFCQMVLGSVKPDNITFVCVLNACSYLALLKEGVQVHASIVAQKFESDIVVGTALINMYGKCGQVLHAVNVFNHIPTRDPICWNTLMTAYAQNGHSLAVLSLLQSMLTQGVKLTSISFLSVVDACAGLCLLQEGRRIHAIINGTGYMRDTTLQNALLNMYGKCGSLNLAGAVFDSMPFRDTVSWTAMVSALAQNEKNYEALHLYDDMRRVGVGPNNMTFVSALNSCASLEALEGGLSIHNTIAINCVCSDSMVEIALVHMYGRCRSLNSAKKVFWEMVFVDVVAWNVMIASLVNNNHSEDALEYFNIMLTQGFLPDNVTYASLLDACFCVNHMLLGQQLHVALIHLGYQQDSFIQTSLISMYGRCADVWSAKTALDSFSAGNVTPMNAYLSVLTENGYGKEALDFFHMMLSNGLKPDKISYVHAIDACATLAVFEEGKEIHDSYASSGYKQDRVVETALISMYGKCGSMSHARSMFEKIREWDLVLCNAMASAFAQSGHVAGTRFIFLRMQGEGIKPDQVTFISYLTACSHAGAVEEGSHLFVSMSKDYCLKLLEDHYVCMIDILGRAANLNKAAQLIESILPCDITAMMWVAFLGACQMHSDLERGWLGAQECFYLVQKDASVYVLMSNISAAAARHDCTL